MEDFELRQIVLPHVRDIYAVYKLDDGKFIASPVDAFGLVAIKGGHTQVVGLQLGSGYMDVVDNTSNFEGLYRKRELLESFPHVELEEE